MKKYIKVEAIVTSFANWVQSGIESSVKSKMFLISGFEPATIVDSRSSYRIEDQGLGQSETITVTRAKADRDWDEQIASLS